MPSGPQDTMRAILRARKGLRGSPVSLACNNQGVVLNGSGWQATARECWHRAEGSLVLPFRESKPQRAFWLPQAWPRCSQGGQVTTFCKEGFCLSLCILGQAWCPCVGCSMLRETAPLILGIRVRGHEVGSKKAYWSALPWQGVGNREWVPKERPGVLPGGVPRVVSRRRRSRTACEVSRGSGQARRQCQCFDTAFA